MEDDELYLIIQRLAELDEQHRSGELRGGLFPAIFAALATLGTTAARVAPKIIQAVARGTAKGVGRLGTAVRGSVDDIAARVARSAQTTANRAAAVARARATPRTALQRAAKSRQTEGTLLRKNALKTIASGLTLSGVANIVDTMPQEEEEEQPTTRFTRTEKQPPIPRRPYLPVPQGIPDDAEEEQTDPTQPETYAYNPVIRSAYAVGESRNPLSQAYQTTTLVARRRRGGGATHRTRFLKKMGLPDKSYSIEELAKISGIPKATLQEVYNRGIGAYKTNPTSVRMKGTFKKNVDAPMSQKLSKEQWAMARLYSFLNGSKKHDKDLR